MGLALEKPDRTFLLFVRCNNCLCESTMGLNVPNVAHAPHDADELIESAALQSLSFHCDRCGGAIGELIGIGGGNLS